jgi:hypothetical protein
MVCDTLRTTGRWETTDPINKIRNLYGLQMLLRALLAPLSYSDEHHYSPQ